MSSKSKIAFAVLLTFSLTSLLFTSLLHYYGVRPGGGSLSRLSAVAQIIDSRYIGDFDREKAEDAAIRAYIAETGDSYASYYDSESAASFKNMINGNYIGIGIELYSNPSTGELTVLAAYSGSPARRAGIKTGDVILKVNGMPFNGETMNEAVDLMKGTELESPVGTELTLSILRGGEPLEVNLKREEIDLYKIESSVVGDSLLYLKYTGFSEKSAKTLGEMLKTADKTYKGVILDLRENPGGNLDSAVDICDMFLKDGLIMYTEDKSGRRSEMTADPDACELPLAVLVDEGSASASEVVAGCIQARGRGVIIGEKTFGKGVSQMIFLVDPKGGEMVKITGYKNYRPDGIWLNEAVSPDIEVESEPELNEFGDITFGDNDAPLQRAIEELSK